MNAKRSSASGSSTLPKDAGSRAGPRQGDRKLKAKQEAKDRFDQTCSALKEQERTSKRKLKRRRTNVRKARRRSTTLKIDLAKAEERVVFWRDRLEAARGVAGAESARRSSMKRAASARERVAQSELSVLNGESELASLYSKKEFLSARQKKASRQRASVERLRSKSAFDLRSYRDALEKRREQNRTKELSLERFAQEIKTLEERMKEDYNLDLSEVEFKIEGVDAPEAPTSADDIKALRAIADAKRGAEDGCSRETVDSSRELIVPNDPAGAKRRKKRDRRTARQAERFWIRQLGSARTRSNAQDAVHDVIQSVQRPRRGAQVDSEDCRTRQRRLPQNVRLRRSTRFAGYFCTIFKSCSAVRRLDVGSRRIPESRVGVIARPPGKELKSLSLMSGGEKSLTCVALLLAIFQHRTSPVCILDEVGPRSAKRTSAVHQRSWTSCRRLSSCS